MTTTFPLTFGNAGEYELSKDALEHILWGHTVVRPRAAGGDRGAETVLAGGLHTYEGWKRFLALHPKIVHLLLFQVGVHDAWWFARSLQNGVITLKIPRRLFTGNAASITQKPDNFYKSGYLWKTLFPTHYSEVDILEAIGEALINIDREDSTMPTAEKPAGVIYGYAATDHPLTAIKIRIQLRGNQIHSAFPAWDQPRTGNNGKAYSHEHSISFAISESSLDAEKFYEPYGPVFANKKFDLEELLERTPEFIKKRKPRNPAERTSVSLAARAKILSKFAAKAGHKDLKVIDAYLADYPCSKDPFGVQRGIYANRLTEIDRSSAVFNAAQLTENVGECFWVLGAIDERLKTRRMIDAMVRFLSMAIVHTGGLNTLMFKVLLGDMVSLALTHHNALALREILSALSSSPCRATLYTEFDLRQFFKRTDKVGFDLSAPIEVALTTNHLLEFIAFNLGENYLLVFNKEERLALARDVLDRGDQWRLSKDVMSRLAGRDFDFFMPEVIDLSKTTTPMLPIESDLMAITRDYGRMMVMLRQRIVLEDTGAYEAELDSLKIGTPEYAKLARQKQKYWLVRFMHDRMLQTAKTFADSVGYKELGKACHAAVERLPKERVPLPKRIPDYITSWQHRVERGDLQFGGAIEEIFRGSQNETE